MTYLSGQLISVVLFWCLWKRLEMHVHFGIYEDYRLQTECFRIFLLIVPNQWSLKMDIEVTGGV